MNTFGSTGAQYPLYDPRGARRARARFRRDRVELLERANSLYVPGGRWPARGWLLMARADYDQLNTYATNLQLDIADPRRQDNVGTIKNLSIVQAQCVTRGVASDEDALYLVEVTDGRGVLKNKWFSFPTVSQYNIRSPAYPETFQLLSLKVAGAGRTTWTWSTMLQDLWTQMGTFLGAWPGLPAEPAGTPEGYWFPGVPAWDALCGVLDHLGLTVAADLTAASPYTIVSMGADDAAFDALQTKYASPTSLKYRLEDDAEWIDTGSGRVPRYVKVLFRRRNDHYGTEETVTYRNDAMAQQWDMLTSYSVTVDAPATFLNAAGTHHLWSDFTVRHDQNSDPLPADVTTATTLAQQLVTRYFDRIYSRTSGFMSQTFSGALPFSTGAQVDGVCWYQDHDARSGDPWHGWRTSIVRGGYPPWPHLTFPQGE